MAVSARPLGRLDGNTNWATEDFPVANGVTVTEGDFVYFASGRVTSATVANARVVGVVQQTATGNSAGTVKVLVVIDRTMRYLMDNDNVGTTFDASHVGSYFDLIGATGAQLVDTSTTSATVGQVVCTEYNPQIDPVRTDTSWGVFMLAQNGLSSDAVS